MTEFERGKKAGLHKAIEMANWSGCQGNFFSAFVESLKRELKKRPCKAIPKTHCEVCGKRCPYLLIGAWADGRDACDRCIGGAIRLDDVPGHRG